MDAYLYEQLEREGKLRILREVSANVNRKPGTDICPSVPMSSARTIAAKRALRQSEITRESLPMPKRTSFGGAK